MLHVTYRNVHSFLETQHPLHPHIRNLPAFDTMSFSPPTFLRLVLQEFELLMQENDSLQRKLISQEEEFRLQNETLMHELNRVSVNRMKHSCTNLTG